MVNMRLYLILLWAAFSLSGVSAARPAVEAKRPNFVIILTDDQGYQDLGCFGSPDIKTPRIDKMAAEGARLTSFYSAAPVCSPSRAGLMTGCYPRRVDMAMGSHFGVLLAGDSKGLNPQETTMAEVLKSAGYKTGMFGKWHLGDQPEFLPTRQGFDEFFGLPFSWDIHPTHPRNAKYHFPPLPLLDGEQVVELDPDLDYLTRRITDRAVGFIEASRDQPFFLYLAEFLPHNPLHVSPPFMKDVPQAVKEKLIQEQESHALDDAVRNDLYPNAISEIDWSVGQILGTLERLGLAENTLVFFTSDNGPAARCNGSAKPLQGHKGQTWEGGMRVPAVVRWPAHIPAGQVINAPMSAVDLLPTFAGLAGGRIPADRVIDGKDILPLLAGNGTSPHDAFFYYRGNRLEAVRSGKWKWRMAGKKAALYDLEADIGETTNVLAEHPEVAERLRGYIAVFKQDLEKNSRPAGWVKNPEPLTMKDDAE